MLEAITFWGSFLALVLPWVVLWLWERRTPTTEQKAPPDIYQPRVQETYETLGFDETLDFDSDWEPTWMKEDPEWLKDRPPVSIPMSHQEIRRWRMLQNGGSHTRSEWLALCEQFHGKCARCKRKRRLTKDHIVPVVRGGSDDISNIQPLCKPCNSRKHDKIADYRPQHLRVYSE